MIIGDNRAAVVENIAQAVARGDLNTKVELNDPTLSPTERKRVLSRFFRQQATMRGRMQNQVARSMMKAFATSLNPRPKIIGRQNLAQVAGVGGVIVTANHFNPLDSLLVRQLADQQGQRLFTVIQDTNLAMNGLLGFLMNHLDVLPLAPGIDYLGKTFPRLVNNTLAAGNWLLIYPEEEMWFNYRKPRPPKRGAYHYAAKNQVPILPLFTAIQVGAKREKADPNFFKTSYQLHVLAPIFPDPQLSVRENEQRMQQLDFEQRQRAYEEIYGRSFDAPFSYEDIAGWAPQQG